MTLAYFINPNKSLNELARQRNFFWRVFTITALVFLCL